MSPPWWPDRFDELFRTNATRVRAHRPGPVQRARARGTAAHRLGRAVRHRGRCRRGLLGPGDLLRTVVTGSSSNDEAVFVFLGDALRSGAAPPETQRAMIAATARLPHIETERTQGHAGRPCLAVRYLEPERSRVVPSVCFDETTATLVEEDTFVDGELEFRSVVVERGVVTKVPDEVRRNAPSPQRDPHGPGSTGS